MRFLARLLAAVLFLTLTVDVSAAEAATRPSVPRSVKATPANQSVKVSWVAPKSNGGAAINKYAIQRWNGAKWVTAKTTGGSARSWTNTGLTNGTKYFYRVFAYNRLGRSNVSAQVSATPRTVPLSPRLLEADLYNRELGAFWEAPTSNGGATIDSYRVEISTDGATWTGAQNVPTVAIRTTSPVKFSGLTAGSKYWIRVRAHNIAGYSVGTSSGPYRAITAPDAVTNLLAVGGNGQVALSWVAPVSTSSAPAIAQYKVEQSEDGTTWTEVAITTTTSFLVTGLTNGTTYHFRVSARSATERVGYGTTASVTPNAPGQPTVPQNLTLEGTDGDNLLDWTAPANNGGFPLTRYEVEYWIDPTDRSVLEVDSDITEKLVEEVALTHTFRVRACNGPDGTDCGVWSGDIGPIPGVVENLVADPTSSTVSLDWDAPLNPAVSVDGYTVSRSANENGPWTVLNTTPGTTYADDTAAPATTYWYRVVANGADGSGGWEPLSTTTDPAYQLSVTPNAITVTENSNNTFQVTLTPAVTADTVVTVSSDNPAAADPATPSVTIPAGQSSANVQIDGIDDLDLNADSATITLTYGTQTKTVSVTVNDDDQQAIVLSKNTATFLDGESTVVDVNLAFQPNSNVTVQVSSADTDTATVSTSFLTFTPSNWDTVQSVTITGEAAGSTTVSFSALGITTRNVSITVEPLPEP